MMIGIWKKDMEQIYSRLNTWFTAGGQQGYALYANGRLTMWSNGFAAGREYYCFKKNDIIEMILDFSNMSFKYIINGKDYGKAFDVVEGVYVGAVFMETKNFCIQILDS